MPTHLTVDEHVELIQKAAASLADSAAAAGMDAPVPTCPGWTVRDLVAHQGMVHRWAAAHLRGDREYDTAATEAAGKESSDALRWLADGAADLVATIESTPDDAEALVFLRDAPPPRRFWARRQAHETTIHAADALAARLGRMPKASDTAIIPAAGVDGVDELLLGFLPRRRSRLRSADPFTLSAACIDTDHAWTVRVSEDPPVTSVGAATDADVTFSGTAVQLYLSLWNRSDDMAVDGRAEALEVWRATARVRWG